MMWVRLRDHRCALGFPETLWERLVCVFHPHRHLTLLGRRCLLVRMREVLE